MNDGITPQRSQRLCQAADKLGSVSRRIEKLQQQQAALKLMIAESGCEKVIGDRYEAFIFPHTLQATDWQAVLNDLQPSYQILKDHTTTTTVQCVTIRSRT